MEHESLVTYDYRSYSRNQTRRSDPVTATRPSRRGREREHHRDDEPSSDETGLRLCRIRGTLSWPVGGDKAKGCGDNPPYKCPGGRSGEVLLRQVHVIQSRRVSRFPLLTARAILVPAFCSPCDLLEITLPCGRSRTDAP